MALIDTYTTALTAKQAKHLLDRATFGASLQQIKDFTGLMPNVAVEKLLASPATPLPPIDPATNKTYIDQPFVQDTQALWQRYTKLWWMGLMASPTPSAFEKLALFWQNHFVSTLATVPDAHYVYQYLTVIRKYTLGNFKQFVIDITKNAAMLRFLNGVQNTKAAPNENYARELQELFTIGRLQPNGTANYTEDDVKTAAKVLTGWRDTGYRDTTTANITVSFLSSNHDVSDKTFSSYYQNTVIKGRSTSTAGDDELKELIDMILKQPETARFICRKLYRWYINYDITSNIETNFIEPLAAIFRKNYDIKETVSTLLKSQHFFDEKIRGAIIKSPLDFSIGVIRFFDLKLPDAQTDVTNFYDLLLKIYQYIRQEQQDPLDQPSVFGWRPYYDTGYYQIWISSNTLAYRGAYTDALVVGVGYGTSTTKFGIDVLALVKQLKIPSDPAAVVNEIASYMFAIDLPQTQLDYLIDDIFLSKLPRYEWGVEWLAYTQDPTSTSKQNAVKNKLLVLIRYMLRLAEYQIG
jgi:uncharacterized protein (DUF1800 family)